MKPADKQLRTFAVRAVAACECLFAAADLDNARNENPRALLTCRQLLTGVGDRLSACSSEEVQLADAARRLAAGGALLLDARRRAIEEVERVIQQLEGPSDTISNVRRITIAAIDGHYNEARAKLTLGGGSDGERTSKPRRTVPLALVILVLALGALGYWLWQSRAHGPGVSESPAVADKARPIEDSAATRGHNSAIPTGQAAASPISGDTSDVGAKVAIRELAAGTGPGATRGDAVKVHYTGTFLDGRQFDSSLSRGKPFSFKLGQNRVIKGWEEGVLGMKKGGRRELTIPAELAYGAKGSGKIPPNTPVKYEIEVLSID